MHEAKAKFSEVLRRVCAGEIVTITFHGRDIAEIRHVGEDADDFEGHVARLMRDGIVSEDPPTLPVLSPIARRPGGLARFLKDRE